VDIRQTRNNCPQYFEEQGTKLPGTEMFTGITEEIGRVLKTNPGGLVISAGKIIDGMETGGSIAVNGVCLTATCFTEDSFSVDKGGFSYTGRRSDDTKI
jgi:hypothetical protein